MDRILTLYDSDEQYARRFMEYFKKKQDYGFKLAVFTRKESLLEFTKEHSVDLLLLGEKIDGKSLELDNSNIRHIYKLADKSAKDTVSGYTLINRYRMLQAVISDIKADLARLEQETGSVSPDKLGLISIISPIQDLPSLVFAWSTGLLMSEQKKVLLISMELLPVKLLSTADYSGQPLTELIYYLKENTDIISRRKTLACYQGSLSYLAGVANGADILALNSEDMQKWITALKEQANFQLIIYYSCSNSDAARELVKSSDKVIYCCKKDFYADVLFDEWVAQMKRAGISLTESKFIKLTLPDETRIRRLPITPAELGDTDCFHFARQYIDRFN